MWQREVGNIEEGATSFFVSNGSRVLARWVVDPTIPWVLVEGHFVGPQNPLAGFGQLRVPLGAAHAPRLVRATLSMDLLFSTDEFLDVLGDMLDQDNELWGDGMLLWQLDKEPKGPLHLGDKMFADKGRHRENVWRGHGVRLMMLCPHAGEVTEVAGLDAADVRRAWERVKAAC